MWFCTQNALSTIKFLGSRPAICPAGRVAQKFTAEIIALEHGRSIFKNGLFKTAGRGACPKKSCQNLFRQQACGQGISPTD
jgi:hypothetical protein